MKLNQEVITMLKKIVGDKTWERGLKIYDKDNIKSYYYKSYNKNVSTIECCYKSQSKKNCWYDVFVLKIDEKFPKMICTCDDHKYRKR
jgi:hypothetical protein